MKKNKKESFVHVHTHSDFSALDGCGKISGYVAEAKKRGNPAIAFTEHGTMRGYLQVRKNAEKNNIKPIYGIEFYIANDMNRKGLTKEEKDDITKGLKKSQYKTKIKQYEDSIGIRDRWHTTCWAINNKGLKNLQRLSSLSYIDGFYYKPRIDIRTLCKYNSGLAVSTGCLVGPAYDNHLHGRDRYAYEFVDKLYAHFGDRFYIEIQPHNIDDQARANKFALQIKNRTGNRLIAGQDAHYINPEDWRAHDLLLCIGTNSCLNDKNRFRFDGKEFFMKTRNQMKDSFRKYHGFLNNDQIKESLDTTVELAERCSVDIEIDYLKALLPSPGIPEKYRGDEFSYLKDLCLLGWSNKNIRVQAEKYYNKNNLTISFKDTLKIYTDRLKFELKEFKRQKIVSYLLIVHDLYKFMKNSDILTGACRGSCGGSLVCYLLGITSIDPIEYNLLFERFINPDRIDVPDIDIDVGDSRRREVIDYLIRKYGRDKVCQISTIGRLSGKSVLRDVGRVLRVPLGDVNSISNSIIDRPDGHPRQFNSIEDSFGEFEICKQFDKKYPKVKRYAMELEGMSKSLGIHAAGVIASPEPLMNLIPLETRKYKGEDIIVSAIDMNEISSLGLVKLDFLGLRTLTIISDCLKMIEKRFGKNIDIEKIDMNDRKILDMFSNQDFSGVFQYDTPSSYKLCNGIKFETFEDIPAMTALNRPGATRSGLAEKYLIRKKNPKKRKKIFLHPLINEICKDTYGVIVYQEHCIEIFKTMAGFSPGKADSIRKAIGKKKAEELKAARPDFIKGCKERYNISVELAKKIFKSIEMFGQYGFNRSHATGYGTMSYWCQFLKGYYPVEFYWALLKNEPDRDKINIIAKDAKRHGIKLLKPHICYSEDKFSIDESGNIRGSLVDIKGVGDGAAKNIMQNQPYKNIIDFADKIDKRKCNVGAVTALIKGGAFEDLLPNQKYFEENIKELWKILQRRNRKELIQAFWQESKKEDDYTKEEKIIVASRVNPLAFGDSSLDAYDKIINENIRVKITEISDNFWSDFDGKKVFIIGTILGSKVNQVGDYHTGDVPTKKQRRLMFWGKRYGSLNIESRSGQRIRIKFDIDIFEEYISIFEADIGTPIIVHGTVDSQYQTIRSHLCVNIEILRNKLKDGIQLDLWEKLVCGNHPAKIYPWKNEDIALLRRTNKKFLKSKNGGIFTGIITNIRLKYDKNKEEMAFFGLLGENYFIDVVCFSQYWIDIRNILMRGLFVSMEIYKEKTKERGISYFFNGGKIKILRNKK